MGSRFRESGALVWGTTEGDIWNRVKTWKAALLASQWVRLGPT